MTNQIHCANTCHTALLLLSIEENATALSNSLGKEMAREAAVQGFNYCEFDIIRMFQMESVWTTTELAQALSTKTPTISRAVRKLVDVGILRRKRSQQDRRVVFLTITEKGLAFKRDLHKRMQSYEQKFTQGISAEDLEICMSTIARIVANHTALEGQVSAQENQY